MIYFDIFKSVPDDDDLTVEKYTPENIIIAWLSVNSVNMSQSMFIWLRASLHWHWLVLHDPVYSSRYSGHCTGALYTVQA